MDPIEEMQIIAGRKTIKLSSGKQIEVKELSFIEATTLLKKLSQHAATLISQKKNSEGKVETRLDLEKLTELVTGVDDLAIFVATKSSSMTAEEFQTLSTSDALTVLDAALEQTLNDSVINKGKALGDRLIKVMGGRKSVPQSTS